MVGCYLVPSAHTARITVVERDIIHETASKSIRIQELNVSLETNYTMAPARHGDQKALP